MNPKDISHANLLLYASDSTWHSCCKHLNEYGRLGHDNKSRLPDFDENENYYAEILSRLNEADELRKENEELCKENERLLKDYYELRVNAALLVACDDALESLDSNYAKESEASHE